jgi:hypothetical protein
MQLAGCGAGNSNNSARIDDKIESVKVLKEMSDEKNKIEKKYVSLMNDVKHFMDDTERNVLEANTKS